MNGQRQTRSVHDHRGSEIAMLVAIGVVLYAWLLIVISAHLGGGQPSTDPQRFLSNLVATHWKGSDGGFAPWALVDAGSVTGVKFWPIMILFLIASSLAAMVFGAWRKGGSVPWLDTLPLLGNRSVRPRSPLNQDGFAGDRDLRDWTAAKPRAGNIVIGDRGRAWRGKPRLVMAPHQVSKITIAPANSGKTTCHVYTEILYYTSGAVISTSTKAEVVDNTMGFRQTLGPCWVYDPRRVTSYPSMTWDPLTGCKSWRKALDRARSFVENARSGKDGGGGGKSDEWAYWSAVNVRVLAATFYGVAWHNGTIRDVRDLINESKIDEIIALLVGTPEESEPRREALGVKNRPETEFGTCFSTAQQCVGAFSDPDVLTTSMTSSRDFDVNAFLGGDNFERPGTLFIISPQMKGQDDLIPLCSGLIMEIVDEVRRRALAGRAIPVNLLMVLDECANIAPLRELPELVSADRGNGITVSSYWQTYTQIRDRYGPDQAEEVWGNSPVKVLLGSIADNSTGEMIMPLLGKVWRRHTSRSRGQDGSHSSSFSMQQEDMFAREDLRKIPRGRALVIAGNKDPFWINQLHYQDSPEVASRAQMRPLMVADYIDPALLAHGF